MANQQTLPSHSSAKSAGSSRCAPIMLLLAVISLALLACGISSLPVALGPTATPPSAQSAISKSLALLNSAKSFRFTEKLAQAGGPALVYNAEVVGSDKSRLVNPSAGVCQSGEMQEIIRIGETAYERCGQGAWMGSASGGFSRAQLSQTLSDFASQCAPRGSLKVTKLNSNDVWTVESDCPQSQGGNASQRTMTWFIDPSNYQLRQVVLPPYPGQNPFTVEFKDYDDSSIAINAPSGVVALPKDALDKVIEQYTFMGFQNIRVVRVNGNGQLSQMDKAFGNEEVVCFTVSLDKGGKSYLRSMMEFRQGRLWSPPNWSRDGWLRLSCPGEYIDTVSY